MLRQIKCGDLGGEVMISLRASGSDHSFFLVSFFFLFAASSNITCVEIIVEYTRME